MKTLNASHNSFMDEIITIRDDLWTNNDVIETVLPGDLSDVFAMQDTDLIALFKEMKTAKSQLLHAKKTGQMVSMAKWRFESAESAYQTRLIEVRHNSILGSKTVMDEEEAYEKRTLHEIAMQERMNAQFTAIREKRLKEKKKKEKSEGSWFFYFMLGIWLANNNLFGSQNKLKTSIRNDFSLAH